MNIVTWTLIIINAVIGSTQDLQAFRLPKTVSPFHYKLKVLTKLNDDFSYNGKVWIDVEALSDVNEIVLNSRDLKIYENETTVEELSNSALESIFRKNLQKGPTTKVKRDAATASPAPDMPDKMEKVQVTESMMTEGPKPADEPLPTSEEHSNTTPGILSNVVKSESTLESSSTTTPGMPVHSPGMMMTTEETHMMAPEDQSGSDAMATEHQSATKSPEPMAMKPAMSKPKAVSHVYETDNAFLKINLSEPLLAGRKYRIQLRFKGILSDALTGFYRVSYRNRNSRKTRWMAATVFEPNEARSAFPCFDEPEFKATFDIALAHDKKFTALSNMPVKTTSVVEGKPDYQWTYFQRTPRMPTYLISYVISDFQHIASTLTPREGEGNTTFRFWARPDSLHRMRYAAKVVPGIKRYLDDLLQVPDPMPKYDFVALPLFLSKALENWGLISFAEKNIFFNPGFTSVTSKFETTHILGHELAHTWFGNMITPKYWDEIWLSEGFSNYFEILAADHVEPTWDAKTISLLFSYLKVFSIDAMHSSHPLVPRFKKLSDVDEIFDSITYQKGYFVVRMLNYSLGEETFLKGLRDYLLCNRMSNVDENDLWDSLTKQAHADASLPEEYHLRDIMENWTRRTGYPVIDVYRDYDNHTATVTQRRFLRPKFDLELRKSLHDDDEPEDTSWWIPLTYTTGDELNFTDTKPKLWIKPTDYETVLTDMPDENQFVLMNLEASGLYRVNYDERNWELLIELLLSERYTDIAVVNRVQLIDDLLDFARAGEVPYNTALDAMNYLTREKDFLPWHAALNNLEYISRMFRSTESNKMFRKFLRGLVSKRFEELGMEPKKNESIADAMSRKQIVKWACITGNRQCTRKSVSLFKKWTGMRKPDENNPIPNNLRGIVYCSAIAHGGAKDWNFLWNRYLRHVEPSDKMPILNGLGCSRNVKTLRKYLDWSVRDSSGIRKQDTAAVFQSVAKNDVGFNVAKDFLKHRVRDIRNHVGNNSGQLTQMVEALAAKMNQESHLQDLEIIERDHFSKLRTIPRSFKQAKERVTFNIDWLDQNYDLISDWLKQQRL